MGASLLHNMLLRELALVGVLVIVLIIFFTFASALPEKKNMCGRVNAAWRMW